MFQISWFLSSKCWNDWFGEILTYFHVIGCIMFLYWKCDFLFPSSLCKCKIFLYIMGNLFQFIHKICNNSAVNNCYYWCFSLTSFLLSCRLWKQLFGLLTAIANEVSERYLEDIGCCKACINSLSLIWFQCARVFLTDSERFT